MFKIISSISALSAYLLSTTAHAQNAEEPFDMSSFAGQALQRSVHMLRASFISNPDLIISQVSGEIDPGLMADLKLEDEIPALLSRSLATASCLEDEFWKIGFFDPMTNIWIVSEFGNNGPEATRMGVGIDQADNSPSWWPFFTDSTTPTSSALQKSALLQLADFSMTFGQSDCAALDSMNNRFFAGRAAAQLVGIAAEWPEVPKGHHEGASKMLSTLIGKREAEGWLPWRAVPGPDGESWLVPFYSKENPEEVILTSWGSAGQGQVSMVDALPIVFKDVLSGKFEENAE